MQTREELYDILNYHSYEKSWMSSSPEAVPKPKKSVALSGVPAGNTALCTVGRTGNDLHYRGYDILDFADKAEFEEIAYLLVHEKPPTRELSKYKARLRTLRALPAAVKSALEYIPKSAHPMDVMRTGVSVLGTMEPESEDHNKAGAQRIADRLMASLGSMLLYWYHYSHHGKRIETETGDDSIGGTSFTSCTRSRPPPSTSGPCTRRSSSMPSTSSTRAPSPAAWSPARAPTCTARSAAASARCAGRSTAARTSSLSRCCPGTARLRRRRRTSCGAWRRRRS